ncbi:hypothetical protein GYMLUDRAFT_65038 [Collybiopsis luxurians FD-317 M1]|uniref:Uncharacterized protein n=1 Tax=Collybiopsis luxurians FD-317 M1 TaxID=944289 RepID=A0A0D0B9X8_9AGAR|nr:hypothetical protein GYMLUDRAFT_65038 [Collybiopsis luxurians FD-317 M1]
MNYHANTSLEPPCKDMKKSKEGKGKWDKSHRGNQRTEEHGQQSTVASKKHQCNHYNDLPHERGSWMSQQDSHKIQNGSTAAALCTNGGPSKLMVDSDLPERPPPLIEDSVEDSDDSLTAGPLPLKVQIVVPPESSSEEEDQLPTKQHCIARQTECPTEGGVELHHWKHKRNNAQSNNSQSAHNDKNHLIACLPVHCR